MNRGQDLLRQNGIASTWTLQDEITVRLFDLERARQLIRTHRESLKAKAKWPYSSPRPPIFPDWLVQLLFRIVFLSPVYATCVLLIHQYTLSVLQMPLLEGPQVGSLFAICYFVGIELSVLTMVMRAVRRRREKGEMARKMAERD